MPKDIWINLPVKDLQKSREFFRKTGFTLHPGHENSKEMVGLMIGEQPVMVMLVQETTFAGFTGSEVADARKAAEVILSLGTDTREEVDEITRLAEEAGATIFSRPQEMQGWMYGAGFADLDGHRWNLLYMDSSRQPRA